MKGRVRFSKDKADIARSLKASENSSAPFQTYADILTFAAALGASRNRRSPLDGISLKNPDPVPIDQFFTRGYDSIISLLAITSTNDPKSLLPDESHENARIEIFEEYANAGLEILQTELTGVVDYAEHFLLILSRERAGASAGEFDLTRFL